MFQIETHNLLPRLGEAGRGLYEENRSSIQNPVSSIRFQYDNHLGSACLELDTNAAIISYEEYHPFGTTSYRSGRTQTEVSLKRYKYVGKERDEETGLYYYGARYYAGWICRFVSVDPLQHKYPHYTPFQYAGNKPISYIDLDGLEEAKTPDATQTNTTKTINQVDGEITSKTMTQNSISVTENGSMSISSERGTQYFTNGVPNGNYSYEFKTFEFSSSQQFGVNFQGAVADNTNVERPIFNFEISEPDKLPQPLGTISSEHKLPKTSIGPYNPLGYSKEFLDQNNTSWSNKKMIEQAKQDMSQLHPVSFGGPNFGIGAVPALHEGIRQVPSIIFEASLLTKFNPISYQKFSKITTGVFKGSQHNQIRGSAYHLYKRTISTHHKLIEVSKPALNIYFKSFDVMDMYDQVIQSDTIQK